MSGALDSRYFYIRLSIYGNLIKSSENSEENGLLKTMGKSPNPTSDGKCQCCNCAEVLTDAALPAFTKNT